MDPRLLEAAQKGDVDLLKDLIGSNPLILEEAALQGDGNTPLHVACVAGHSNFVRELLKLKPKLVEKVNADGLSPLHIAAAGGNVETVREILKAGRPQHLCLVKGREGRIPLHWAAANGEVDTMKELLSASPESVKEKTAREETALHLAVKNNRFEALVVLVEYLKQRNKEQVINWKDKNGDTVLQLAAAASNFEVVSFLLSGHALNPGFVEVNALNGSGSTPLDVLPCSDRESREILIRARAQHGQSNLPSSEGDSTPLDVLPCSYRESREIPIRAGAQHGQSNLPCSEGERQKSPDDGTNNLLVVATLIATTTFQVVIQPITLFKTLEIHSTNPLAAYFSFVSGPFMTNLGLGGFLATNTLGFFLSVLIICRANKKLPLRVLLKFSMYSMVATYLSCLGNVPSRSLRDDHYSPLGEILIGYLAPLVALVFLGMADRFQKESEKIEKKIAREGLPECQKAISTLLKCICVDVEQGNANRAPRPNCVRQSCRVSV